MQKTKVSIIKRYWLSTPELFSEQYQSSILTLLSPTQFFLHSRRRKVLTFAGNVRGKKVLDVGCGSGILMADFIKRGAYVVGIDYSKKMLVLAKKEMSRLRIPMSKFQLIKANAIRLPFKEKEFDILLATGLTDYLADWENRNFIKEASRVLKRNGVAIISFPAEESPVAFLRSGIGLWVRRNLMKLPPIANTFSFNKIKLLLTEAGLKESQYTKVFYTMWLVKAIKV